MEKRQERLTVLKEYMTLDDMTEYFDLSKKTISNWEKDGLKTVQVSNRLKLYRASDIRDYLDKFSTGTRDI